MMKKIFISAGEVSGDVHGAKLVSEIKKIKPDIQFMGMGSERMAKEGVQIFADLTTISTIGIFEPIKYIPQIYATYIKIKKRLQKENPDCLIVIDYQGYHMVLIKAAKQLGIPVIYYIAPQEWQWGTEKGGKAVVRYTDKILSIFQEETAFYNRLGGNAVYIGHPILDLAVSKKNKNDFFNGLGISPQRILSIFPGSRPQELTYIYPILLQVAIQLKTQLPGLQIVVSIASSKFRDRIKQQASQINDIIFYEGSSYDLIANTTLSLVTSGTITLEHACLGTPCLVHYRFNPVSFWIGTRLFAEKIKKIKYMALPNIIMDQLICPEFLQDRCDPKVIVNTALNLLNNPKKYQDFKSNLLDVKKKLGEPGVIQRAASEVVKLQR